MSKGPEIRSKQVRKACITGTHTFNTCGVGPALIRFIERIWKGDTMYPKRSGYYGKSFRARRGVRQGDIISPMIFNIMVDAVVRHWKATKRGDDKCGFYADDGILAGLNSTHVQEGLDIVTASFATMGLKMNARKTEFLSTTGKQKAFHKKRRPLETPAHFVIEMEMPGGKWR